MFSAAAELLIQNISTTMARITLLSSARTELITKTLKTIRPLNDIRSENVGISPELTPWHYMVMAENRLLLINQNDPESYMSYGETEALAFTGMRSALIVPIAINGLTIGLITMGEMREWDRFSYDAAAISFCKAVAAKIGSGMKLIQLSRALLNDRLMGKITLERGKESSDIYQELKTPLTSLRGSIDLLRMKGYSQAGDSEKIMELMEKSANRIMSILDNDKVEANQ
jgi:signal transduction histidine kinase